MGSAACTRFASSSISPWAASSFARQKRYSSSPRCQSAIASSRLVSPASRRRTMPSSSFCATSNVGSLTGFLHLRVEGAVRELYRNLVALSNGSGRAHNLVVRADDRIAALERPARRERGEPAGQGVELSATAFEVMAGGPPPPPRAGGEGVPAAGGGTPPRPFEP